MTTRDGGERDDVDARFAEIVARWDESSPGDSGPRGGIGGEADDVRRGARADGPGPSPREDVPREPLDAPVHDEAGRSEPAGRAAETSASRARGVEEFEEPVPWRTYTPAEDPDDETFTPPPPEPLPAFLTDWPFYLALCGLVLGPIGLVLLVVFAPTERHLMWGAAALTIAGFVTLVLRQPHDRDPDDTDDGARV